MSKVTFRLVPSFPHSLRRHFLLVPLVIEGQQAVEQFAAGGFGHGEAEALLGVVEVVAQTTPSPLVGEGWGGGEQSCQPYAAATA